MVQPAHHHASSYLHASLTAAGTTAVPVMTTNGGLSGAHNRGEDLDEDDTEGRQRGTEDTNIDLDSRPVDDIGLVPGWVARGCKVNERPEAEDGDDGDESSYAEHDGYTDLLAP